MNIDVKLEAEKIAEQIIDGMIDQACFDYENVLGNYHFLTASRIEKRILNNFGSSLAKFVRKNPEGFFDFSKRIWYKRIKDGRPPLGAVLAVLEEIDPERMIPEIVDMCRDARNTEDVETLVNGFETVILRDPDTYLPVLETYIREDDRWVKRLVIITVGHMMYRYKTDTITKRCLEIIRPVIGNGDRNVLKASSWVIGSYGVRADQKVVSDFIKSFSGEENPSIVWTFAEAFRRSKISLQPDVVEQLIPVFDNWSKSKNSDVQKSAKTALKYLKK